MALWSPSDDRTLTNAWRLGLGSKAIGEALNRTPGAVRNRAGKLGLERRAGAKRIGDVLTADMTPVKVNLPDELLPPFGQRGAVIREALEIRQRMAPHEGPPPTDRVVLVRDDERPGFVALCRYSPSYACWRLRWTPGGGEAIAPESWPESYRWCELPGCSSL